jgi:hypothetical protein
VTKRVTTRKIEKYIKCGGECPRCSSAYIEGGPVAVIGNEAWQVCDCTNCGLMWTDTYVLASIEIKEKNE